MKQSGKKSVSALSVVAVEAIDRRPDAPADLTDDQKKLWVDAVKAKPVDWFTPDNFELLAAYCRHAVALRSLSKSIDEYKPAWMADEEGLRRYEKLSALRDKESNAMLRCMRAMRLTQQSKYDEKTANTASKKVAANKPWQG